MLPVLVGTKQNSPKDSRNEANPMDKIKNSKRKVNTYYEQHRSLDNEKQVETAKNIENRSYINIADNNYYDKNS
eukprot:CAMPEP_0170549228 /NCGR_PEP_ID=MMETSP0211-20121228/7417_1 /TAXON_ID=311385 /ORGANISM="Pseudokeronopsis sp., Strain OXSARD2" /LENGTH=73 /DNA_ID=CAMNT_0010855141 /DNA_START=576 /DNA_END=797 /DNA_ORIENTATION=-